MSAAATRRHLLLPSLLALLLAVLAAGCVGGMQAYRHPNLPRHDAGAAHFIVFDVGQADSMLVLYRDKTLLVDAGVSRCRWTFRYCGFKGNKRRLLAPSVQKFPQLLFPSAQDRLAVSQEQVGEFPLQQTA